MKKFSGYPLVLAAISICCSLIGVFLITVISGRSPVEGALDKNAALIDRLPLLALLIAPMIACFKVGKEEKNLWLAPIAGIAAGVAGAYVLPILLVFVGVVLVVAVLAVIVAVLGGIAVVAESMDPWGPWEIYQDGHGNTVKFRKAKQ